MRVDGSAIRFATVQPARSVPRRGPSPGAGNVTLRALQQFLEQVASEAVEGDQVSQPAPGIQLRKAGTHLRGPSGLVPQPLQQQETRGLAVDVAAPDATRLGAAPATLAQVILRFARRQSFIHPVNLDAVTSAELVGEPQCRAS